MTANLPYLQGSTQKFFMARVDENNIPYCLLSGLDNTNNYYWYPYPVKIEVNCFNLEGSNLNNCVIFDLLEVDRCGIDKDNNLIFSRIGGISFALTENTYQPLGSSNNVIDIASSTAYSLFPLGSTIPCNILDFNTKKAIPATNVIFVASIWYYPFSNSCYKIGSSLVTATESFGIWSCMVNSSLCSPVGITKGWTTEADCLRNYTFPYCNSGTYCSASTKSSLCPNGGSCACFGPCNDDKICKIKGSTSFECGTTGTTGGGGLSKTTKIIIIVCSVVGGLILIGLVILAVVLLNKKKPASPDDKVKQRLDRELREEELSEEGGLGEEGGIGGEGIEGGLG